MSLYNFFQPVQRECLPDPRGPLSRQVPSSATASANSLVTAVLQSPAVQPVCTQSQRGQYTKLTPEQKAEVGKRAVEHGIASTILYATAPNGFPSKRAACSVKWCRDAICWACYMVRWNVITIHLPELRGETPHYQPVLNPVRSPYQVVSVSLVIVY